MSPIQKFRLALVAMLMVMVLGTITNPNRFDILLHSCLWNNSRCGYGLHEEK